MNRSYEEIKRVIVKKLKDMSKYSSFECLMLTYKPADDERNTVMAVGDIEVLFDITTKNMRLLIDNIKEYNPNVDEDEIISEMVYKIKSAKLINMQTEITKTNNGFEKDTNRNQ